MMIPLLFGLLLALAFPTGFYEGMPFLAPIALSGFLFSLQNTTTARGTFKQSFLFFLSFFAMGIHWVFVSIHTFGQTPLIVAGSLTILFILFLSTLHAFLGPCWFYSKRYYSAHFASFVLFPTLWILLEWIRSTLFTGFPWLLLGTSQVETLIGNFAPIGGVGLVSWLVVLIAALTLTLLQTRQIRWLLSIAVLLALSYALSWFSWTEALKEKTLKVALIQPNEEPRLKWNAYHAHQVLAHLEQAFHLVERQVDWIIFPEGAVPIPMPEASLWFDRFPKTPLLISGIPAELPNGDYRNQMRLIHTQQVYEKHLLVPFGEYIPFERWLRGLINFFDLPMSSFSEGTQTAPLEWRDWRIGSAICYEMAYPEWIRTQAKNADILLTISNDGWFGSSAAPYQHLQIAQLRAKETGKMVLRATNNGISALIDSHGHVIQKSQLNTADILIVKAEAFFGKTPWVRFGSTPFNVLLALLFVIMWRRQSMAST